MTEPSLLPDPPNVRAGRNEARKVRATWLNNTSVALFLAGFLQPFLALVQQQREISLAEGLASLSLIAASFAAYIRGQAIARGTED